MEYTDILPKQIMDNICSRSRWLSKQFPQLQYDDLTQEGILQVLELLSKTPEVSTEYILKAINNIYSTIMSDTIAYRKHFVQMDDIDKLEGTVAAPQEDIDFQVDVSSGGQATGSKVESLILSLLKEKGATPKEVMQYMGIPRSTLYSIIKRMKRKST
jgi:hypothetical protein